MRGIQFMAVLALICIDSAFAAQSSGNVGPKDDDTRVAAEYLIEPPDVIQIEMAKLTPLSRVSGVQSVTISSVPTARSTCGSTAW